MKTKFTALFCAAALLLCGLCLPAAAQDDPSVSAAYEYTDSGEYITISGTTPAVYEQAVTVIVYDPRFVNGVEDVREANGELSKNPAEKKPLAAVGDILRIKELRADADGAYSVKFSLDGIDDKQYMIIKASGGGKTQYTVSMLTQFQTKDSLKNTLEAFEKATADTLGDLFAENQLLLDIKLDADYTANKALIHKMFVSVRDTDIKTDASTGKKFNKIEDVQMTLGIINALRTFPKGVSASDIKSFIDSYKSYIDYDFSESNKDYTLVKSAAHTVAANILSANMPETMSDVSTALRQGVGVALLNTKDNTTVAPVINAYATILGIDTADYKLYCDKYTAYEVNKAFVGRDFTTPQQVVQALKAHVTELENAQSTEENTNPGNESGYQSVGGGGGSSSVKKVLAIADAAITSEKDKDAALGVYYTDMTNSHWAYEAVKALSAKKIISGNTDGSFAPEEGVTREQLVKMLCLATGISADNRETAFSDISAERWSAAYIAAAANRGIVNGYEDGAFKPEAPVTRQDAAVMLLRALERAGRTFADTKDTSDSADIAPYAAEAVAKLCAAGVINGYEDGTFKPLQTLTRAQAAQLIYGVIK